MNGNIRCTNLRLNMDKELHRKAWEQLQGMDKKRYHSYSQFIAEAIIDHADRLEKHDTDPYLETREKEEQFVSRIIASVESVLQQELSTFLVGCVSGISMAQPVNATFSTDGHFPVVMNQGKSAPENKELDSEVDFDFLGQ